MRSNRTKILIASEKDRFSKRIQSVLADDTIEAHWEALGRLSNGLLESFEFKSYDVAIIVNEKSEKGFLKKRRNGKRRKNGRVSNSELINVIKQRSPNTNVLYLVEPAHIQDAIFALKAGALQYTKLPISDKELKLLIETALSSRLQNLGRRGSKAKKQEQYGFAQMIGESKIMQQVYAQIRQAAESDIPVLLTGETGTGKELVAQAIHRLSNRSHGPFVAVSLAAFPNGLVASELFGHEKGAFTGADQPRKGVFEQADNGVVFLDEIDSIAPKMQVSLLRLIENKEFYRLGGNRKIKSQARLIAATNQDLETLVHRGEFREDLFYRLDVFRITLPPLKERQGDMPLLVEEFINRFNKELNKKIVGVAPECFPLLENYDWPGNVRELKNVIQRAMIVCEDDLLMPEHLPPRFQAQRPEHPTITFEIGTPIEEVEKKLISHTLTMANNNRKRAAELLGISRRAIYNKINKHKLA